MDLRATNMPHLCLWNVSIIVSILFIEDLKTEAWMMSSAVN